jgi:dTDP-4-dehydrorhamnose 3,5-epimerase
MTRAPDRSSLVGSGAGILTDVAIIRPTVYEDDRGSFRETFSEERLVSEHGIKRHWPQDNHSWSHRNVLRGMHFQLGRPQGKLVSCVSGSIFDVAVDLRPDSDSFGLWVGADLSRANGCQLWVPEGFGHGFLVMSDEADVMYKVTEPFVAGASRTLAFDDPTVGVAWPLDERPILSDADAAGLSLAEVRSLLSRDA